MSGVGMREFRLRSQRLTTLAVVNFVLGGLRVLLSVPALLVSGASLAAGGVAVELAPANPGADWNERMSHDIGVTMLRFGGVLFAFAVALLVVGILTIVAGTGLLGRRRWGRTLGLVVGGVAGAFAGLYLAAALLLWLRDPTTPPAVWVFIWGVVLLLEGGYCALAFAVLLNTRVREEFA